MTSLTDTLKQYEDITRDSLKVNNPALLKTGALGTLVNIFANLKYDTAIYYNKLLREINVSTVTEFKSILFHSGILNYNINFATPSTFQISFLIPDFSLRTEENVEYTIRRDSVFQDAQGFDYTLEEDIKIFVNNSNITAKSYGDTEAKDLEITRATHPTNPNITLYLVEYSGLKQYLRTFNTFLIPDYEVGENYEFSVAIPSLNDIYEINAWYRPKPINDETYDTDEFLKISTFNISKLYNLEQMPISYNKYNASQFDKDLFLTINENQLVFTIGDGINGVKLNEGDQIYIETKLTKGARGNLTSTEMTVNNVEFISVDTGGFTQKYTDSIKVLSLTGGEGGKDIDDIEYTKSQMIDKASTRGNISTLNDFEVYFTQENSKPFVDTKFFNSQNHVFIYNILRDDQKNILPTNTFNIEENEFQQDLFLPIRTYEGIELISPFYYKKKFNYYTAYMIKPEISIELQADSNIDNLKVIENRVKCLITYDYFERKTRIELRDFKSTYTYRFKSNLFNMEFNTFNNYNQMVNQRFTDEYCIIEEPLTDITLELYDGEDYVMTFTGIGKYFQLVQKQNHYHYSKIDQLDSTKETRYILNLPFLSLDYLKSSKLPAFFTKLDDFFKLDDLQEYISFNVLTTQSFYNTILLEDKYRDFVLNQNNNGKLLNTQNMIILDIVADKFKYNQSIYKSVQELEFDIKGEVFNILSKVEGFNTQFYETTLENNLANKFDLINNVDVVSPKLFSTNQSTRIYDLMQEELNKQSTTQTETTQTIDCACETEKVTQVKEEEFSLFTIIDFVPPYFYFDFNSLTLNITFQ